MRRSTIDYSAFNHSRTPRNLFTVQKLLPRRGASFFMQQFSSLLLSHMITIVIPIEVTFAIAVGISIDVHFQSRLSQAQDLLESIPEVWTSAVDQRVEGGIDVSHPVQKNVYKFGNEIVVDDIHYVDNEEREPT